jgi:hypothetical protein
MSARTAMRVVLGSTLSRGRWPWLMGLAIPCVENCACKAIDFHRFEIFLHSRLHFVCAWKPLNWVWLGGATTSHVPNMWLMCAEGQMVAE